MKNLLWLAAAALLAGAAPSKTPLADFVRAVLPTADKNFTPLRGAKIQSLPDTVYAGYKLRLAPSVCADCRIYDFYGRGTSPEYWDVSNIYTEDRGGSDDLVQPIYSPAPEASPIPGVPPGAIPPPPPISSASPEWSVQKTENYVIAQLTPLLHGFSLRHTTSTGLTGGMVPTLIWTNNRSVNVKAQIYPQMVAGFLKVGLIVRHNLARSVHVLLPATTAQLARMQSATQQLLRTALPAASANFSMFRGPLLNEDPGGHDYGVTASFAPAFRSCEILDIGARMGPSYPANWTLLCTTVPTVGKRASQEELVRSAISSSLPAGFASATDAKSHGYDYLWNNTHGVSIAIDWGDPQADVVSFTIRIAHTPGK